MGMELQPELKPEQELEPEPNTKACQRHQSAECCTMKLTVSYLHTNKMLFFKLFNGIFYYFFHSLKNRFQW